MSSSNNSTVYFVTGTTSGIGLEYVNKLILNPSNFVIATVRDLSKISNDLQKLSQSNPKNLKIIELELESQSSIDQLDEKLQTIVPNGVIDVFIQNAGIYGNQSSTLTHTDRSSWLQLYQVNSLAPVLIFQKVYPYLQKSEVKKTIFISSLSGSIGSYFPAPVASYGQSKAALNYSIKALSEELRSEGFKIIAIHPGVVITKTLEKNYKTFAPGVFQDFIDANKITTDVSVGKQLEIVDNLTDDQSGKFWNYDGTEVQW
ncbi:hypothetical protein WICMUC_002134 [Wickerhamomyces mucosus]|uniref:Uncharacterized protein n=1 Tax=Wickerhamomyces mucosus TaxID=1378264 RepID=A0A9P8PRH0_9ASCO|nr:hypothetical protein WICMUC_002134 [Wickerhamomyces mucosus]